MRKPKRHSSTVKRIPPHAAGLPAVPRQSAVWKSFGAILILFFVLLLFFGFALPPQYGETFLGEMKVKQRLLEDTGGKRIILAGASSIPFGVKSELLKKYFPGYGIVDFGMYADLGTVVMLDLAKARINEGDIFILMPEQNVQALSCYFSGENVWQAADGAFQLLTRLPLKRYEHLAAAFPSFAGKKLFYAVNGSPDPKGVYARASFNGYGDIDYPDREYNIMPGGYNPNDFIRFDQSVITEEFIEEMNAFAREAAQKGASVYYHFPPMNEAALANNTDAAAIDAYYDFLQSRLAFPLLGSPHRCLLESGWFYDTNFHLNNSGATVFTFSLIEDLKLLLRDTSPTDIPLPPMPAAPSPTAERDMEGDNSCGDCFTYRRDGAGWRIDGLTEKGASSPVLILPVSYKDLPVTGVSETLFAGNATLRELTVQPNTGILYDGMFQGCTSLEKLILTGRPSDYSVGGSLMEGADFLIYVPADLVDGYRRDYSWQEYGSYIMARGQ